MISKLNTLGAIFLLIVVLYGTTHKTWIRISYEINKLEIIDKFCINKEVTTYSCDGKCHLKTQLEKADEPASNKPRVISEENILLFNFTFKELEILSPASKHISFNIIRNNYSYIFAQAVLDPPKFS
ncbi:MAG: hypothetical protein HND54_13730 [Bacteroidetes bacterium]|nr:hypothetical protein [Flavobacteriales bacterium]NOG58795.1 hypothetical protein [Bacteroidota bacterium]